MPHYLKVMHLVPRPHGQHKTAGHAQALPHQKESFSSPSGAIADQMSRVLPRNFTVKPPVRLAGKAHHVFQSPINHQVSVIIQWHVMFGYVKGFPPSL